MKNLSIKKLCLILILLTTLNSCAKGITGEVVWGAKIDEDEVVKDLLINEDGSKVVVIAKKYYYFADDEKKMVQKMLLWDGKEQLKTSVYFRAKGSKADAKISFEASIKDLSKKQIEFLKSIEGRECDWAWDKNYENKIYTTICLRRIELKGTRISVKKDDIDRQGFVSTGLIKKEQDAAIFEDPTPPQIAGKILLTPFAVAADILLAPIYFILILGAGIGGH